MWIDKENQVYSERTDLTEETFRVLVKLCLARRIVVTAENKDALYETDQTKIAEHLLIKEEGT